MAMKIVASAADDVKHLDDVDDVCLLGDKLYSGGDDGLIKKWNTADMTLEAEANAHDSTVHAITTDGKVIYSGSNDNSIKFWNKDDLTCTKVVKMHIEAVRKLQIVGDRIYSGSEDATIRAWFDNKCRLVYGMIEEVYDMLIDGKMMYCVRDRDVIVCEITGEDEKKYSVNKTYQGRFPLCKVGDVLCSTTREGSDIQLHRITDHSPIAVLKGHERIVNGMCAMGNKLVSGAWDNMVMVWDLETQQCVGSADTNKYVMAVTADQESNQIYAAGYCGFVDKIQFS